MSLITNEIHILDGFRKTAIVFAADRRLSKENGSFYGVAKKLFRIPYLEAGVSYFGLAAFRRGHRTFALSEWLENFIAQNSRVKNLEEFTFRLREALNKAIPQQCLERYASGFHVCGYGTTGIPEFWFISNILAMDDFVYTRMAPRYSPPSPDFLDRDAKALGWNGYDPGSIKNGVQFYRNGDYRLHAAAWHRLDAVFQEVVNFSGFKLPDLSEVVKFKMEVIAYFYKKFSKRAIIGRPIDAFVLRKQLP